MGDLVGLVEVVAMCAGNSSVMVVVVEVVVGSELSGEAPASHPAKRRSPLRGFLCVELESPIHPQHNRTRRTQIPGRSAALIPVVTLP
jgi:hypothetical protein